MTPGPESRCPSAVSSLGVRPSDNTEPAAGTGRICASATGGASRTSHCGHGGRTRAAAGSVGTAANQAPDQVAATVFDGRGDHGRPVRCARGVVVDDFDPQPVVARVHGAADHFFRRGRGLERAPVPGRAEVSQEGQRLALAPGGASRTRTRQGSPADLGRFEVTPARRVGVDLCSVRIQSARRRDTPRDVVRCQKCIVAGQVPFEARLSVSERAFHGVMSPLL